jgi:alkanesulfonate monooxygenase
VEVCWMLPDLNIDRIVDQVYQAEEYGFDSVLVSSLSKCLDPWVTASKIAFLTQRIRILVAQNTNYLLPMVTAKALNTLNLFVGDRIDINIVSGTSKAELEKFTQSADHSTRYKRTKEYVDLFCRLQKGTTTYNGEFFEVVNTEVYPKSNPDRPSKLFLGGGSREAMEAAAEFADYYLVYGHEIIKIKEQFEVFRQIALEYDRQPKCGMLIDIITRKNSSDAWECAEQMYNKFNKLEKRMVRYYHNSSDSVAISKYADFHTDKNLNVGDNLWAGLSHINTSHGISIVGSHTEVIDTIGKFREIGMEYLLLTSLSDAGDLKNIGEYILPKLTQNT